MSSRQEIDRAIHRFERNQVVAWLAMVGLAAAFGGLDVALGVVGGGLLIGISYFAIKGGVSLLAPAEVRAADRRRAERRKRLAFAARLVARYALLAVAAYVMLVRLRLHPVGMLAGVSTPFIAVALEVVHLARSLSRSRGPR
jgi:hypothetical protein